MGNNLTDRAYVKQLLERYGTGADKRLGQNFLVNPSVCPRMAEACRCDNGGVMEIGPGVGALTAELAKRAKSVKAVEIDRRLLPLLGETLGVCDNVEIIEGDALKVDLKAIFDSFGGLPVSVCANLPYYITAPVVLRLLESRLKYESITVMVQREAAQRLCAAEGSRESGASTLCVRYYAQPEILFGVSAGSFYPPPKVDSCVIRLTPRESAVKPRSEKRMFEVIRAAFSQRRKTAVNAISAGLKVDKGETAAALERAGIPPAARPENLTLADYAKISDII